MISVLVGFYFAIAASFALGLAFGGNSHDDALPAWLITTLGLLWPVALPWLVGALICLRPWAAHGSD